MLPKSSKNKIAFTGTNSSGKTTMALEVTTRLKSENHYLAEVVSSQDRKVTWKDEHFPVDERAHYGMITGLIYAEVAAELKGDADVVITDRSVLDLYAIAKTDHPNGMMVNAMQDMIDAWVTGYKKIFYLPPLAYQEDGKRPPNEFRLRTHGTLLRIIEERQYPNLEMITDRSAVMGKVRKVLGIKAPHDPIIGFEDKIEHIASVLQCTLLVKRGKWANSDLDVWFLPYVATATPSYQRVREVFAYTLGSHVKVHVMFYPPRNGIENAVKVLGAAHSDIIVYPYKGHPAP